MKKFSFLLLLFVCLIFIKNGHAQVLNVCQGDSLRLSTTTLNIPGVTSVEWYRDNNLISTDTAFVITQSGVYTLRCAGTGACLSDFSQPLTVIVDTLNAVNDSTYTQPGTAVNIKVLINDISVCYPVDTPTLTIVQQGNSGTAVYIGGGIFNYTPNPGFVGVDTFYYTVDDVNGNHSNVAMVIISISTNNPLPLSIGYFDVAKVDEEAHLFWNTYRTDNASHFEVERSGDGKSFEYKGKVLAPVKSNDSVAYNYWDKKPLAGKNYYRLKMVDVSGHSEYSEIRMVTFNNNNPVKVYPIPANDFVNIELGQSSSAISYLLIVDATGREVIRQKVSNGTIKIDLKGITSGAYYIKFTDSGNTAVGEVIKFNKI